MENKRENQEKKELKQDYRKFQYNSTRLLSMASKKHLYESQKKNQKIQQKRFADSLSKISQSIYQNNHHKNKMVKSISQTSYEETYFQNEKYFNDKNSLNRSIKNENKAIDERLKKIQVKMRNSNYNHEKKLKNVSKRAHNLSLKLDKEHSIDRNKNEDIKRRTVLEVAVNKMIKANENKERRLTQTMFTKKIYNEEKSNKALQKFNEIESKRMDMLLKKQIDAERRIQNWLNRKEEISFPKQKFKIFQSIQIGRAHV